MSMTKSEQMARIRGNNLGPEMRVQAVLLALGAAHGRNLAHLPGSPDFVVGSTALFVHGCYWHSCPKHRKAPKTNVEFWSKKFAGNVRRDARAARRLRKMGYKVRVIWEHDTKKGEAWLTKKVQNILKWSSSSQKATATHSPS